MNMTTVINALEYCENMLSLGSSSKSFKLRDIFNHGTLSIGISDVSSCKLSSNIFRPDQFKVEV